MDSNSFGKSYVLTSFGESHGTAIGGIIDGCPAGVKIDFEFIRTEMQRRRPGQSEATSQRDELDEVEFLSGIFDGHSTGAPIGFTIKNTDHQSEDYDAIKEVFRPSHADFTYQEKYGVRDYRGGGRASARETAVRVVAGAIAKLILQDSGVSIHAWVPQIGYVMVSDEFRLGDSDEIYKSPVRCPDAKTSKNMLSLLDRLKDLGDTVGGIIVCKVENVPVGLGEPVFDKLSADLAKAIFSIPAVHGFEYGSGFLCAKMRGSEHNDPIIKSLETNQIETTSNYSGGIVGGISNGMPINFRVAFKPASSIAMEQKSVDLNGNEVSLKIQGRHDPCVVPRAVAVVEAMTAMVLVDHVLRNKLAKK